MSRNSRISVQRVVLGCAVVLACAGSPAWATFHLWDTSEVYSNADGTIQFIELFTTFSDEEMVEGHYYGSNEHDFTFPNNLPSSQTANKRFLMATVGFAALPGAPQPDFIIPDGFVNICGDTLELRTLVDGMTWDSFSFGEGFLPVDGTLSLNRDLTTGVNSPTNFAGDTASITTPGPALASKIYFADGSTIKHANPDGSEASVLIPGLSSPDGVAVDIDGDKIYWVQQSGLIRRANLDGSGVQNLLSAGGNPHSIALDLLRGQVYWTETSANRVRRANLDGSNVQMVVSGGVDGLTVDPAGGKVYFTQGNQIRRANLDGSGNQMLYSLSGPHGLALDIASGKLYWTDLRSDRIERGNMDGSGPIDTLVNSGLSLPVEISLDLTGDKMYWTDLSTKKVQRANLDGSMVQDVLTGLVNPFGISLDVITLPPPCPADQDDDGIVSASDLAQLLGSWGPCPGCPTDLNGDGVVEAFDLALLLGAWGPCPD